MKTETIQVSRESTESKVQRRLAAGRQDLLPAVVAFVLIAIVGSVGAQIKVWSANNEYPGYPVAHNGQQGTSSQHAVFHTFREALLIFPSNLRTAFNAIAAYGI